MPALQDFINAEEDDATRDDKTPTQVRALKKQELVELALRLGISATAHNEFVRADDNDGDEEEDEEGLGEGLREDEVEQVRQAAAEVDDQKEEREEVLVQIRKVLVESERQGAHAAASFSRRFPLNKLHALYDKYDSLKVEGANDDPDAIRLMTLIKVKEPTEETEGTEGTEDTEETGEEEQKGEEAEEPPPEAYTGGQSTKDRQAAGMAYSRLRFSVHMCWTFWLLVGQYAALYYLSETPEFQSKFGVAVWDAAFVASLGQLYTRDGKPPIIPFADNLDQVIKWAGEEFPGFRFLWYHFNFEIRIGVEPFVECEAGNPLKLWNSLLPRSLVLIAAERVKVARVDLCFLQRLLYWQLFFPGIILVYLAKVCKWIFQDVNIEWINRRVSIMCRQSNVTAVYIAMMCHCSRGAREIKSWFRCMTGGDGGKTKEATSSLEQRRERQWTSKFTETRQAVQDFLLDYIKSAVTKAEAPYKDFVTVNVAHAALAGVCRHSRRTGDAAVWGYKVCVDELYTALNPAADPAHVAAMANLTDAEKTEYQKIMEKGGPDHISFKDLLPAINAIKAELQALNEWPVGFDLMKTKSADQRARLLLKARAKKAQVVALHAAAAGPAAAAAAGGL